MNQKGFTPLFIILGIILVIGIAGGAYYLGKYKLTNNQPLIPQPIDKITLQEAKQLVKTCNVSIIFRPHQGDISITLKDGTKKTFNRGLEDDEFLKLVDEAGSKCNFRPTYAIE